MSLSEQIYTQCHEKIQMGRRDEIGQIGNSSVDGE